MLMSRLFVLLQRHIWTSYRIVPDLVIVTPRPQRADSRGIGLPAAGNRPAFGDVRRSSSSGQRPRGNQTQPGRGAHRRAGFPGKCVDI